MRPDTHQAAEIIDAALLSGDEFTKTEARKELLVYVERWGRCLSQRQDDMIRIHVSDWNYQDKCYDAEPSILEEFKEKVVGGEKIPDVWDWFVGQIDEGNVVRSYGIEDAALFFDYKNPVESVEEWDLA